MIKPISKPRFTKFDTVESIESWCNAENISVSCFLQDAGLSKSSMTWWKKGVQPSRSSLLVLEAARHKIKQTNRFRNQKND